MKKITSANNPTLRKAIKLHESRGRRQQERIIVFGANEIRMARQASLSFCEVFVCEELIADAGDENGVAKLVEELESAKVLVLDLPRELFHKVSFGNRNDGIVATAERPDTSLDNIKPLTDSLFVVLESIEKPGNIGAVFRSADAAGATAVLMADARCDSYHPNAIRSSLGTVFSMPCIVDSSSNIRDFLTRHNFQILAAKVDATNDYFSTDLTGATAIVLGSEHDGLGPVWQGDSIRDVRIPMNGHADSLNVSVSAGIILFEAMRQRIAK